MKRASRFFLLLLGVSPLPASENLLDRRILQEEICRAAQASEELVEKLAAERRARRFPLLERLRASDFVQKEEGFEDAVIAGIGETYCRDEASLAAVVFLPLNGEEWTSLPVLASFRREGSEWKLLQGSLANAARATAPCSRAETRQNRWSGLPLESFPAFLRATGREQPERFRAALAKGDLDVAAATLEETLVGYSLERFQDVFRVLSDGPEPVDLVRILRQETEKERALVRFELLENGSFSRESLVFVQEGDGWVILEPYRSPALRTMADVRTLATAIEAYAVDNETYPAAATLAELQALLVPTYLQSLPGADAWGTPLLYTSSPDRASYTIVSAGSDKKFDTQRPPGRGRSSNTEDDLHYANGEFLTWWEEGEE